MKYSIKRPLTVEERNRLAAYSDITAHLLFHRGLSDHETAQRFLSPDYERDMLDPYLLKDAKKAAERVIKAIRNREKIAIYSDYDADGIPGAVIWHDFFNRIDFKNFIIYIPHRHDEGFGLNNEAINQLNDQGVKLIITLDCGISDIGPVQRANEKKMDVIITDHHEPPRELPPAIAIVDHKQADCAYPDKNICGSAVAYKLIQAILKKAREAVDDEQSDNHPGLIDFKEGHEKWLLDMVGIATLSDMVPLTGENRVFAHYGLQVLRKSPRKGLIRLLEKLKISQNYITEDDIAFMITPRINAASRMDTPMDAFNLLIADNDSDADNRADHLDAINNERKGVVASLVKEVKKTIKERYGYNASVKSAVDDDSLTYQMTEGRVLPSKEQGYALPSVIVLGNPDWRPSLLGLAANTCAEEFGRPVFLWGRDGDNSIKGSCRSEGSSNVVEIMRAVPTGVFTQFGGHRHSGGFAVSNEAIHYLEKRLNEASELIKNFKNPTLASSAGQAVADKQEPSKDQNQNLNDKEASVIDMELSLDEVNWKLADEIGKLGPFGFGNPKPVFLFKNVIPMSLRRFGKGNDHIELSFKKENGEKIPAISFFGAANDWAKSVEAGKRLDLVASIEKSMFKSRPELRLRIVDVIM